MSNVLSNWNTWERENTVLVFFFRFMLLESRPSTPTCTLFWPPPPPPPPPLPPPPPAPALPPPWRPAEFVDSPSPSASGQSSCSPRSSCPSSPVDGLRVRCRRSSPFSSSRSSAKGKKKTIPLASEIQIAHSPSFFLFFFFSLRFERFKFSSERNLYIRYINRHILQDFELFFSIKQILRNWKRKKPRFHQKPPPFFFLAEKRKNWQCKNLSSFYSPRSYSTTQMENVALNLEILRPSII